MKTPSLLLLLAVSLFGNPLQEAIDKAPSGARLELPSGLYKGDIVINKPLIIDGLDKSAVIEGSGEGHVITIKSSNVTLKNLTIQHSGESHEKIHTAILAKDSSNIIIENNHIRDALFGIDFQQVNRSKILGNFITSKEFDLGLRGDAIRLWYANENEIVRNHIHKSRDMVVWYSSGNRIEDNFGEHCRYSLHFMYAGKNLVQNNRFEHNSVGIFFMYSSGSTAINNSIRNSIGPFGVGIGMKDTSNFKLEDNTVIYNARGIYIDQSPYQPGSVNYYSNNKVLYNSSGIHFHATQERSAFHRNIIKGNMESVVNDTPGAKLHLNEWDGNYWDSYEGFDRNKDGIGDIPFQHFVYADKLWLYNPNIKFFYGSVAIDLLNFLAKFAPFSEPDLLVTDKNPLMESKIERTDR